MDNIPILGYVSLIAKGEIAMDARRSLLVKSFYETVDSIRRDIHDLKVCIHSQKYDPNQLVFPPGNLARGGGVVGAQSAYKITMKRLQFDVFLPILKQSARTNTPMTQ
jgi:hypothetical protein